MSGVIFFKVLMCVSSFFWRQRGGGEERNCGFETKKHARLRSPAVQRQSASTAPGIATAPRSVVQIPMTDGEQTGFPQVSAPASADHTALPKEVVRPNTPTVRPRARLHGV